MDTTIEIDGKVFDINKTGLGQAAQISAVLKWLAKNAEPILEKITDADGNIAIGSLLDVVNVLAEVATVESMATLYEAILGCDRKFTEKNWNMADFVTIIEVLWNNEAYRKVVSRFFSRG